VNVDHVCALVGGIGNFSGKYLVPSGVVLLRISSDGHLNFIESSLSKLPLTLITSSLDPL
jgi:cobyrinic acid a,c-diamide synthase